MPAIDNLPIELYELIFSNLSINDLFNCRLVNKKFKFATYESVQKLSIHETGFMDSHMINLKCFEKIRSKSIFNFDQYLKYLKICINNNKLIKELYLYNLINLECLEINYMDFYYSSYDYFSEIDINLKNLKIFKLVNDSESFIYNENSNLILNTPKLEKIQFYNHDEMLMIHEHLPNFSYKMQILIKSNPDSIKHLIANNYEDQLMQFKNVEIFEFTNLFNLDENLLSLFNNLKQLKIKFENLDKELENCLIKILKNVKESNRDIDIYVDSVKIINKDKFNEYLLCRNLFRSFFNFQLNNYDLLDSNVPSMTKLYFSEINNRYNNLKNDLPSSFFDKFPNILDVNVYVNKDDKPIDADNLNWFLNNLKYLRRLKIRKVLLDQNFFNNLPITIRELSISSYDEKLYSNINFNFILKLTELIEFYQNGWCIELFGLALESFLKLKYLSRFDFIYYGQNKISIRKDNESIFKIQINYDYYKIKLDYNRLVKECDEFLIRYMFSVIKNLPIWLQIFFIFISLLLLLLVIIFRIFKMIFNSH